jgi:uncharacterized protein YjiS (DUF1127 family)
MTNYLRRHTPIDPANVLDCGSAIRLLGRDDYIIRDHVVIDERPHSASPLHAAARTILGMWRQRYLTRRHLAMLDAHGLADIGLDATARDREIAKPFWKL